MTSNLDMETASSGILVSALHKFVIYLLTSAGPYANHLHLAPDR